MSDLMVRMEHVRSVPGFGARPGLCARGARVWFATHDLDWNTFRHQGIDAATLEATGDAFALAVVAHAREVEARGR